MGIDIIFRIAAIGIMVSLLGSILKKTGKEELAMLTNLAGLIIVMMMIIKEINEFFNAVRTIFQF